MRTLGVWRSRPRLGHPSPLRAALVTAFVIVRLATGRPAAAQSGVVGPTPGLTNQIHYSLAHDPYPAHEFTAPILEQTSVALTFDPVSRRLTLRNVSLLSGGVPKWCWDFHVCYDYCTIEIELDPGAPLPEAVVDPSGHVELVVPVEVHYRTGYATTWCDQMPPSVALGSLAMAATFAHDETTGALVMTDLVASGSWPMIGSLATLDVAANLDGATAALAPLAGPVRVGSPIVLDGAGITPDTLLKVFVATSWGAVDVLPDGLSPTSTSTGTWAGTLPWPWPVDAPRDILLGNGVVSLELVRPDHDYDVSNVRTAILLGNPAAGVPGITSLGGVAISPSSTDPTIATANVETVLEPGEPLVIGGDGFSAALVNLFTTAGNLGPLGPTAQTAESLEVTIPAAAPVGPGAVQVVNQAGYGASNAVSVPIGTGVTVSGVAVSGDTITLTGTGFCDTTVVDLFAWSGGSVVNAGGLDASGLPRIAIVIDDSDQLHFTRPPGLDAGAAYATATNPPFIPFTSSGTGPGGSFTLP